jgi:hypothetical protein
MQNKYMIYFKQVLSISVAFPPGKLTLDLGWLQNRAPTGYCINSIFALLSAKCE